MCNTNLPSILLFCLSQIIVFLCDSQLNRLQDQVTGLKTSKEHLQKQNEDMINTLKEVCSYLVYIESTFLLDCRAENLVEVHNLFLFIPGQGTTGHHGGKVQE